MISLFGCGVHFYGIQPISSRSSAAVAVVAVVVVATATAEFVAHANISIFSDDDDV